MAGAASWQGRAGGRRLLQQPELCLGSGYYLLFSWSVFLCSQQTLLERQENLGHVLSKTLAQWFAVPFLCRHSCVIAWGIGVERMRKPMRVWFDLLDFAGLFFSWISSLGRWAAGRHQSLSRAAQAGGRSGCSWWPLKERCCQTSNRGWNTTRAALVLSLICFGFPTESNLLWKLKCDNIAWLILPSLTTWCATGNWAIPFFPKNAGFQ